MRYLLFLSLKYHGKLHKHLQSIFYQKLFTNDIKIRYLLFLKYHAKLHKQFQSIFYQKAYTSEAPLRCSTLG